MLADITSEYAIGVTHTVQQVQMAYTELPHMIDKNWIP